MKILCEKQMYSANNRYFRTTKNKTNTVESIVKKVKNESFLYLSY